MHKVTAVQPSSLLVGRVELEGAKPVGFHPGPDLNESWLGLIQDDRRGTHRHFIARRHDHFEATSAQVRHQRVGRYQTTIL